MTRLATRPSLPRLVAVVGTTASGKSDLGIWLARRFDGEVISADSRQVYRGLDLGTGKVTPDERAAVPHHLLDVADVDGPARFTVADFQRHALGAIDAVAARGHLPILVGGSGLYVRGVLENPSFPVAVDPALRTALEAEPLDSLVARLRAVDPEGARWIDVKNPRRVVRALEVTLATGVPFSAQQRRGEPRVHALQLGLAWPLHQLRARIEQRVDARMAASPSMLDEVRGLLARGVPPARLLELGLEYRFLTRAALGEMALEPAVGELKRAIYQYARRQLTWFRRDPSITWLDVESAVTAQSEAAVERFLAG